VLGLGLVLGLVRLGLGIVLGLGLYAGLSGGTPNIWPIKANRPRHVERPLITDKQTIPMDW